MDAIEAKVNEFAEWLKSLSLKEADHAVYCLRLAVCIHCGGAHGEQRACQCWNDE